MTNFTATDGTDTLIGDPDAVNNFQFSAGTANAGDSFTGGTEPDSLILVNSNTVDFRDVGKNFFSIEGIVLNGFSTAIFDSSQLDGSTGALPTTLTLVGDSPEVFPDRVEVHMASGGTFSAAGWTLESWVSSRDQLQVFDSAGSDTITTTDIDDQVTVTDGNDIVDLGDGTEDELVIDYSAASTAIIRTVNTIGNGAGTSVAFSGVERFTIKTGSGADILETGDSFDQITANGGKDVVKAKAGNDVFYEGAGSGDDVYDGGADSDSLILNSLSSAVFVDLRAMDRSGQDALGGGTIGDLISGPLGDIAVGFAESSDTGTDALSGVENVFGGDGGDTLGGDGGANILTGNGGADILIGRGGADQLTGHVGNDVIVIETFTDQVAGESIDGTVGFDTLRFDSFEFYDLSDFTISNIDLISLGIDQVGLHLLLSDNEVSTADANDDSTGGDLKIFGEVTITNGVTIDASGLTGDNHIIVDGANLGGGDIIKGGAAADGLDGGTGDDTLRGNGGTDDIDGGGGIDTAVYTGAWTDYTITSGSFTLVDDRLNSPDGTDTVDNVERFQFSNGTFNAAQILNDAPTDIQISVSSVNENGAAGAVVGTLSRTDADTTLGDTASYEIVGASAFTLDVTMTMLMVGASAFDFEAQSSHTVRIKVTDAHGLEYMEDLVIQVNDLNDNAPVITTPSTLSAEEGDTLVIALSATDVDTVGTEPPIFTITGGADQALFTVVGGALHFKDAPDYETDPHSYSVQVTASDGVHSVVKALTVGLTNVSPETLTGTPGVDSLAGGADVDRISGLGGDDTLSGNAGGDRIVGGLGKDIMTGGADADFFVFETAKDSGKKAKKADLIADFLQGTDLVDLSAIDANGSKKGDKAFKFLKAEGADFTGKAGQLAFDQKKGTTFVQGDTNGDGKADFTIEVAGKIDFVKADFVL